MLKGRGRELESGCKQRIAKSLHKMKSKGGYKWWLELLCGMKVMLWIWKDWLVGQFIILLFNGVIATYTIYFLVSHQIECERIFNIANILNNLIKCWLGVENLEKLVIIYKNWLNDTRLDCINIMQGFFKFFFEIEDALLNYNEQLL
jgi:hypothetical protein